MNKNIFAIVPAYNEESHIGKVVREAKKYCKKVVVVDDGSIDGTAKKAKKAGAIVLKSPVNMGKGFALKQGIEKGIYLGAAIIATIDADGQHDAKDMGRALKKMHETGADIVIGKRSEDKGMPLVKKIGNIGIMAAARILFGTRVADTQSGFRVFKAGVFPKIDWKSKGYEMESEIVMNIGKNKLKAEEIPIKTIYSDKYKGTSIADGIKIVANMFWWRLTRWW